MRQTPTYKELGLQDLLRLEQFVEVDLLAVELLLQLGHFLLLLPDLVEHDIDGRFRRPRLAHARGSSRGLRRRLRA